MSTKKMLALFGVLALATVLFTACAGPAGPEGPAGPAGPAGPEGPAGADAETADLSCSECHNDTSVITGKAAPQSIHPHVEGEGWSYAGGRAGCTGCHSGASFPAMVASGVSPDDAELVDMTPIDCRACHQIHTSYTGDDWALTTTDAVAMYAFEGATFDGGTGNLCANCHQARRAPVAEDGIVNWTSSHYGPHHGPQANMLLGIAGGGEAAEGSPASHYSMVENTCAACHLGEGANHTFVPSVAACTGCHADAEDFDINGTQTEVAEKLELLKEALVAKGMLTEEGESVVGEYPEAEGHALWNYIFIAVEDKSMGVHNPNYTKALLDTSLEAMGVAP